MASDPRHIALSVLLAWHHSSNTLDTSLEKHSEQLAQLSKSDRGLCNALIFGVLRKRASIDWIIRKFSSIPFEKIHTPPLYILRIALFQIVHMDRIPVFAAINTSVDLAKKMGGKKTGNFTNAVLRKASQDFTTMALPDPVKDTAKFMAVHYSLPLWLSKRWLRAYGVEQARKLGRQINTIPQITVRTNTLKINRAGLAQKLCLVAQNIQLTDHATQGICFTSPSIPLQEFDAFKLGLFQVQDEAAQMVTQFLAPEPGETILDACAGLGGKTGHIAQIMENSGRIIAVDVEPKKLEALEIESDRLGIDIIQTRSMDLLRVSVKDFDSYFDRVLMDSPCTGLGVMQRNPDTKWKRTKADILRLCAKQKKMLNAAANLVKPGGVLVYAVCSCEPEENEAVVQAFLNKRKDFSIDARFDPGLCSKFLTPQGFIKTYPAAHHMDGFFAALFVKGR